MAVTTKLTYGGVVHDIHDKAIEDLRLAANNGKAIGFNASGETVATSFAPTMQWITTTDASVQTYAVTATFTTLLVYLDSLLCEPTVTYTVSGQNVTFVDTLPVGSKICFVTYP